MTYSMVVNGDDDIIITFRVNPFPFMSLEKCWLRTVEAVFALPPIDTPRSAAHDRGATDRRQSMTYPNYDRMVLDQTGVGTSAFGGTSG